MPPSSKKSFNQIDRMPPQNIEAEVSVLGAVLIDDQAMSRALEILKPEHFYLDSHQKIFLSACKLFESNHPIDLITLTEELKKRNLLESIGGASYLAQITGSVATSANLEHYARMVKEKALLRSLIHTATEIVQEGSEPGTEVNLLLDQAEKRIFEISQHKIETRFTSLSEIIRDSIETIDQLWQRKEHVTGVATGFHEFDIQTAGLQPSDLIVVAGRPSMGKSALVTCICEYVGVQLKKGVAFFSLEMSKEQLVQRMLCSHARVDAQKVRTGYLSHQDWPKLTNAAGKLSEAPIFIDDTPALSVLELRAKARRLKSQHQIQMIVVDYLQLMQSNYRVENRQQEISEISRSLKALARELRVPVIAISQLSRAVESRTGNRPQLSDLRESGAIEQDADVVVLLFREEYYNPTEENRNRAEANIAKQRNGPTGKVDLLFLKDFTRFENPEYHREEEVVPVNPL